MSLGWNRFLGMSLLVLYVCLEHCNLIVRIVTTVTVNQQYTPAFGVVHDTETAVCLA